MVKYLLGLAFSFIALTGLGVTQEYKAFAIGEMHVIALADVPKLMLEPDEGLLVGLPEAKKGVVTAEEMANGINTFVVKTGGDVILFDTGLGEEGGMGMKGELLASLAAAGLQPDDITAVCITHFHFDHVGGLVRDGEAVFEKARLLVPRAEVEADADSFAKFKDAYAGRLSMFDWGENVLPGITALDASGHTRGHTAFLLERDGGRLLIAGDVIHFGGLQLDNPEIAVVYDTDPVQAVAARRRVFDKAIGEGLPVATMHLPFPGIGKLGRAGDGYTFVDLE